MLNHLNLGGQLGLELELPVFADGRLEVMGEEHYAYALRTFASLEGLEDAVLRFGADWVVFPYQVVPDLVQPLVADERWRLVYFDHLVAIFARAATQTGIEPDVRVLELAGPAPAVDTTTVPGLGAVPREDPLERWVHGLFQRQTYPVEAYCLGVLHYLRGDPQRLAWHSAEGVRASGGAFGELYANLGSGLLAAGRLEEARRGFLLALEDLPFYRSRQRAAYLGLLADIDRALAARGR